MASTLPAAPQGAHSPRFGAAPTEGVPTTAAFAGGWWPGSRRLVDELGALTSAWPAERSRVMRVLYSSPDWDDRPRKVAVGEGRTIKSGTFPRDDTHVITLILQDGTRALVLVVPPATEESQALDLVDGASSGDRPGADLLAAVSG